MIKKYSFYSMHIEHWWPALKCYLLDMVSWKCSYCNKRHRYNKVQYIVETPRFGLVKCHEVRVRERRWKTTKSLVCSRGADYVAEHMPIEGDECLH